MNICKNCVFWEYCLQFRYENVQTKYMLKVNRKPNKDGNLVIYVEKCKRYIRFTPYKGPYYRRIYK